MPSLQRRKADKILARNSILFVGLLLICATTLLYSLVRSERQLGRAASQLVVHTHEIIGKTESLTGLLESMVVDQRSYALTGTENFLKDYEEHKLKAKESLAALVTLTQNVPEQQKRVEDMERYFKELANKLEEHTLREGPSPASVVLSEMDVVNQIRTNIASLNHDLLQAEYDLLNKRILTVENKKSAYFIALIIGIVVSTIILLLLNAFLLQSQRKRSKITESLQRNEQKLRIAMDTNKFGAFEYSIRREQTDWDRLLLDLWGVGEDEKPTQEIFWQGVHPDDAPMVNERLQAALDPTGDGYYHAVFRVINRRNGETSWVESSGQTTFHKGEPVSMIGMVIDVSMQKKLEEQLQETIKKLEFANEKKTEFLAHMSHEIRTPLTAISGIGEIFKKKMNTMDDGQKKLVKTLVSSTSALKDLVNDILDNSRIESGEVELNQESFLLGRLLGDIIRIMEIRAEEKNIRFVQEAEDIRNQTFYGDPKRLRQILINLIGNAVKFTDTGEVKLKAGDEWRRDQKMLRIDVIDTGIGIAAKDFELIFERFKQADSSVSRKYGGTGLGLSISRNLAQLMGGDILLSSEQAKGSTFSLLIPYKTAAHDAPTSKKTGKKKKSGSAKAALYAENSKVLLVEDYEGNIIVLGYLLDEMGLSYDLAKTGREAVALYHKARYGAILMDVQMPEMDGFTATREIRAYERDNTLPHTPIIGMTAHAPMDDKNKCIESGMDAYLPKPIVEKDFKRIVSKYMDVKERMTA